MACESCAGFASKASYYILLSYGFAKPRRALPCVMLYGAGFKLNGEAASNGIIVARHFGVSGHLALHDNIISWPTMPRRRAHHRAGAPADIARPPICCRPRVSFIITRYDMMLCIAGRHFRCRRLIFLTPVPSVPFIGISSTGRLSKAA